MEVFQKAASSVLVVLALDGNGTATSQGSGVVVGKQEVVTNCHVVEDAAGIVVRQASGHVGGMPWRMEASVLARQEERDLCLLFVGDLSAPPAATVVRLGSAQRLSVGEEVYAVGAPRGLELSLSRGIVSQLRGVSGKRRAPLVQTDAAISPGSSGGGLFNGNGELVGITTFKRRGENLNFALPVEWVRELWEQSPSGEKRRSACLGNPDFDCIIGLAVSVAYGIDSAHSRASALTDIAVAQVEAAHGQAAKRTFAAALKTAQGVKDPMFRQFALKNIAREQVEARYQQAAKQTVAMSLAAAQAIEDPRDRAAGLGDVASVQAEAGDMKAARRTVAASLEIAHNLDDTPNKRASALATIASAQAKAGDIAGAFKTVGGIDEALWRALALSWISDAQSKAGDNIAAIETARSIADSFQRAETLRKIAVAQAKAGRFVRARRTASEIGNLCISTGTRSEIAIAQAKAGYKYAAKETLDPAYLIAISLSAFNINKCPGTLRDMGAAKAALGDTQGAETMFAAALRVAQSIDDVSMRAWELSRTASAQAKAGDIKSAFKTARGIDDAINSGVSKSGALVDIAVAQAGARDLKGAMQTAMSIEDASSRVEALTRVAVYLKRLPASAVVKHGVDDAKERPSLVTERRSACIQDPSFDCIIALASAVANGIDDVNLRASMLKIIASAQAKAGYAKVAKRTFVAGLKLVERINHASTRTSALNEIASAQAEAGHKEAAKRTLAAALATARTIDDVSKRAFALRDVAVAYGEAGNRQAAMQTLRVAFETARDIDGGATRKLAMTEIAIAQTKAGDPIQALATARSIGDASSRVWILSSIAVAQAEAGDRRTAARVLVKAFEVAKEIDDARQGPFGSVFNDRASALREIVVAQAKTGDATGAIKAARSIDDSGERASALRYIAVLQAETGHIPAALVTADSIEEAVKKGSALSDIATVEAKTGDGKGARRTLAAALETVQSIDDAGSRALALSGIATAQVKAGDRQGAKQTLTAASETARYIDDKDPMRDLELSELGTAQAKAGDIAGAFKTARSIGDDFGSRTSVLSAIATAQAEAGDFVKATRTAMSIENEASQVRALARVALHVAKPVQAASVVKPAEVAVSMRLEASLALEKPERILIQRGLASLSMDVGPVDGIFGQRTRAALRSWQADKRVEEIGYLTREQADWLIEVGKAAQRVESEGRMTKLLKEFCADNPRSKLCGER